MNKKIRTNPKDEQEVVVADSHKGTIRPLPRHHRGKGKSCSLVILLGKRLLELEVRILFIDLHSAANISALVSHHVLYYSAEDAHPAYSEILEIIDENILGTATKDSNRVDAVNKIVFDLLQHGDKGHKYTKGSIAMKIDNWVLLDNFVPKDSSLKDARVKALQSHSKRSKKHMTMRQHRKCGSLDLPKEFHNFSLFKPMHEMWKEYIIKILKNREKQLAQTLLVADLHGAFLAVVECKTIAFKGISGIMIRETAKTFGLITQDNLFRVVPKQGSVFIFQSGCWKITLHGDNLSLRNSTR